MKKPITRFYIYGDNPLEIEALYTIIHKVTTCPYPLFNVGSPLANKQLSHAVKIFGGDKYRTKAQGNISLLTRLGDTDFRFNITDTNVIPHAAVRHICNQFGNIRFLWAHENPCSGIYSTNDIEKRHFTNRFCLHYGEDDTIYFTTPLQLFRELEVATGADEITTIEQARCAITLFNGQSDKQNTIRLCEFQEIEP